MSTQYLQQHYDHEHRWMSYWYQIKEILASQPKNILEVGAGNKTTSSYLRERGLEVTTLDIDPAVKSDVVGSVLAIPFDDATFDTVVCFQVLEHLPFEDFSKALEELHRVSRKNVIISLPHWGWSFYAIFKMPLLPKLQFFYKLNGLKHHVFDGEHYWEIGKKGYPLNRIMEKIRGAGFTIKKEYIKPDSPFHHFFVLEK